MMDFKALVDMIDMPCCVLSVEKTTREIRILVANDPYKNTMGSGYYDGMVYLELVPKDNKFEDYCYRAAILKQRMHAYVETKALGAWTDQTLIPLKSERDDIGYCQFIFEFTKTAETDRMAAVSVQTAEAFIKAGLMLLGTEDFRKNVGDALNVIMEETGAGGGRILLIDKDKKEVRCLCEKTAGNVETVHENIEQVISYDLVSTWEAIIGVSNELIIQNESDMRQIEEKNPDWAESMRTHYISSLMLSPLRRGNDIVGYLYVINFDLTKVIIAKELVELMSFTLGAEIHNYLLLQRLEELSLLDTLTGLKNRRAMADCAKEITSCDGMPFGVVSIDLNGLKTVNDRRGHEAGDNLLIQASKKVEKAFYQDDIFRTGGDEFIVISKGTNHEAFTRKVEKLRCDMINSSDVHFAIGDYWSDGTVDIKSALCISDERMYSDKNAFYERYPELRRN